MANEHSGVKFFIIKTTIVLAVLVSPVTFAKDEEEGSLFEIAQSLLQESVRNQNTGSGVNILSGLVQGFMQTEGGKQLGDMLTKSQDGGAVDLVTNLASIWQASKFNFAVNDKSESKQDSSFDPSILSSVVDLISTLNRASTDADNNNVDENNNDNQAPKNQKKRPAAEESAIDWTQIMSFAGNMISSMSNNNQQGEGSAGGLESILSLLPVVMNTVTGQHNAHASHSIPHHTHSQFLPPFLENLHEYWDHFSNSEFGKALWENSGLMSLVKSFSNSKGELDTNKVFESLENNSFRRQWIKSIASFVAQWAKHFTNPETQRSYLETAQVVSNSFLKAQGYPKEALIDLNQPVKSISAFTKAIFAKQFGLDVNPEPYVGPAILYVQELFTMGQKKGFGIMRQSSEDIESKLSETIDSDVIDPILRVNRAYKFSLRRPECSKYVICAINQNQGATKSGLKPGITKLSSLGAAWYIPDTPFMELYKAAVDGKPCRQYDQGCSEFHTEDIKATTEYYHNEL